MAKQNYSMYLSTSQFLNFFIIPSTLILGLIFMNHPHNHFQQRNSVLGETQQNQDQLNDLEIRLEQSRDPILGGDEADKQLSKKVYESGIEQSDFRKRSSSHPLELNLNRCEPINQDQSHPHARLKEQLAPDSKIICSVHGIKGTPKTMFICLQKDCKMPSGSRIVCHQCIDEQLHKKHQLCTVAKLDHVFDQFQVAGADTVKAIMLKITQLRHRFESLVQQFCIKIQQTVLSSWPTENAKMEVKKTQKKENAAQVRTNQIQKLIGLEILPSLMAQNSGSLMSSILKFQEESISEQIENIYNNFEESIKDGIANVDFMYHYKNLLFNPDDMHPDEVGLTLDRNKLEAIAISSSHQSPPSQIPIKLAFTQTTLLTQNSKSFRINSIKDRVIIGCVGTDVHQMISTDLCYSHCEHLFVGVAVDSKGEVTLYNRGEKPVLNSGTTIKQNDIIELTFHHKQSAVTLTRYSACDGMQCETGLHNQLHEMNASLMGNQSRTVIATLSIEPMEGALCYPFAGVTVEGDSVSLVENIVLQIGKVDNQARKIEDSYQEDSSRPCKASSGLSRVGAFKEKQKHGKKNQ